MQKNKSSTYFSKLCYPFMANCSTVWTLEKYSKIPPFLQIWTTCDSLTRQCGILIALLFYVKYIKEQKTY